MARPVNCAACGQTTLVSERAHMLAAFHCEGCKARMYGGGEQHEASRLFAPAPVQMPGQLGLTLGKDES